MTLHITAARASTLSAAGTENYPFIAWDNMGARADAVTSNVGVETDGAITNAISGTTYDFWMPAVSGSITSPLLRFDMGSSVAPDFFALIGHNMAAIAAPQVSILSSPDNVTYTTVNTTLTNSNTDGICDAVYIGAPTARRWWVIQFNNVPANESLQVAGVLFGNVTTMPRPFYQGFAPIITDTEVDLQSNVSAGGNLLGSSIVSRGGRITMQFNNIADTFLRADDWKGFQTHFNEGGPAIAAWRPTKYTEDLHYFWRDGAVIRPTNSGPRDLMSLSIEGRVYRG